jgi:glucose-1-phosphate adenylyltransferase
MDRQNRNSRLARDAMAFVLAGGRGSRLQELTDRRVKPAVFFGGKSRIIDFALSNALNSGIRRISVATQYKAHSLIRHLTRGWSFMRAERNESFDILPASQRVSEEAWYRGTADAVFQNIDIIESYSPRYVVVLAGDHVYKMDYELMLQQHVNSGAQVTIGCLEVPRMEATGFGVMHVDEQDTIKSFIEKPADPPSVPGKPDLALASMGIYVFDAAYLYDQLKRDAADPGSSRDFGKDMIPYIVAHGKAVAHRFSASCVRSSHEAEAYWRDVGTVDAYWQANIDLTGVLPPLDLYDRDWPIWTYSELTPPAKFVHDEDGRRIPGVGWLHRLGQHAVAITALHGRLHPQLRHGARIGDPALCRHRPRRAPVALRHRSRRAHPAGPGGGRRRGARCAALPPHRERRVPRHAADDRPPAEGLTR